MSGLTYEQLYSEMRAVYLGKRDGIENALKAPARSYAARPENWHIEQQQRLAAIEQAGHLLKFIADRAESFDRWMAENAVAGKSGG